MRATLWPKLRSQAARVRNKTWGRVLAVEMQRKTDEMDGGGRAENFDITKTGDCIAKKEEFPGIMFTCHRGTPFPRSALFLWIRSPKTG